MKHKKPPFTAFSIAMPALDRAPKSTKVVFYELCLAAFREEQTCVSVSVSWLSRLTEVSRRGVYRALRWLEDSGLITRKSGGGTRQNEITVPVCFEEQPFCESYPAEVKDVAYRRINVVLAPNPAVVSSFADVDTGASEASPTAVTGDVTGAKAQRAADTIPEEGASRLSNNDEFGSESLDDLVVKAYGPVGEQDMQTIAQLAPEAILRRVLRRMIAGSPHFRFAGQFLRALNTLVRGEKLDAEINANIPPSWHSYPGPGQSLVRPT